MKWSESRSVVSVCDPMDYTVHGILQARILEWVALRFPGDLPNPGVEPRSPSLQADSLPAELQRKHLGREATREVTLMLSIKWLDHVSVNNKLYGCNGFGSYLSLYEIMFVYLLSLIICLPTTTTTHTNMISHESNCSILFISVSVVLTVGPGTDTVCKV